MKQSSPKNCIYRGTIRHRRFTPVEHAFQYRIKMLFFDIDSTENTFNLFPLVHHRLAALGWFRRTDYHGDAQVALSDHIRNVVADKSGQRPQGKIFLLTHLRYWGLLMNPISVFYCYDRTEKLSHIVLQVTNTPWGEKTLYVLAVQDKGKRQSFRFDKEMHVSPFNPMDMEYLCRLNSPDAHLVLHLENIKKGEIGERKSRHTDATLVLHASPLNIPSLCRTVLSFPHETLKVCFGIYWNALKLWWKRTPVYDHTDTQSQPHNAKAGSPETHNPEQITT